MGTNIIDNDDTDSRCIQKTVGSTGGTISASATTAQCRTNSTYWAIETCEDDDDPTGTGHGPKKGGQRILNKNNLKIL